MSSKDSDGESREESSLLSTSAGGATLLIGLQVGSRALTFIVNQILLRYLSPELLGISTQLEVYSISVLFFARESLRVAIQRLADTADDGPAQPDKTKVPHGHVDGGTAAGRTQAIVNLAYISINLGVVFAVLLATLYLTTLRSGDPNILRTPYFHESLKLYGFSAIWELLSEPCFVVVQQKSRFKIRAAAESVSTVLRCVATCGCAIWAAHNGRDIGVLPFALGQAVYALSLSAVYYPSVWGIASVGRFSLFLNSIYSSDPAAYLFSYFSWPLLTLSGSLFAQSIVKHVLTQGDTILLASLASQRAQGIYALANNYGGLVARLILQPVEESSRNYFGKLLFSPNGKPPQSTISKARNNLQTLMRAYGLLSVYVLAVGPTMAPLLLEIIAGSRWSTSGAGNVLATYCYYIPLLAINGLTEAFVSSVATEAEVNRQSMWMLAFSAGFGGAAFFFLKYLDLGAEGLVWANVLNMVFRIIWSTTFISSYMKRNKTQLELQTLMPKLTTIAAAGGTFAVLHRMESAFTGGIFDILETVAMASILAILVAISEQKTERPDVPNKSAAILAAVALPHLSIDIVRRREFAFDGKKELDDALEQAKVKGIEAPDTHQMITQGSRLSHSIEAFKDSIRRQYNC